VNENPDYMQLLKRKESLERTAGTFFMLFMACLAGAVTGGFAYGFYFTGWIMLCAAVFCGVSGAYSNADANRCHFELELIKLRQSDEYHGPSSINSAGNWLTYWILDLLDKKEK